jgi:phage tail sheath protein FI
LKSKVGAAFGHLSYYAPYVVNSVGNTLPLSSYVAGIASSRYLNEGFQQAPAGSRYPLRDASALSFNITSQQQEVTYALGLNPARELPNRGIVVWGARTISSNPLFKFVSTRAILNVLLDVLNRSFDDILFEQIGSSDTLFTKVRTTAITVLQQFYNRGAFFGNSPSEAYKVVCDYTNNNDDSLESGSLACDIFVSTSPTLERLFISVIRTPAGQVALISDSRISEAIRAGQSATTL